MKISTQTLIILIHIIIVEKTHCKGCTQIQHPMNNEYNSIYINIYAQLTFQAKQSFQ